MSGLGERAEVKSAEADRCAADYARYDVRS